MTPTFPALDVTRSDSYTVTDPDGNTAEITDRTVYIGKTLIDGREARALATFTDELAAELGDDEAEALARRELTRALEGLAR